MEATINNLSELQVGDIVKHVSGGKPLVVLGNYGTFVVAVFEQNIMNPHEWVKITKSDGDNMSTMQ